MVWNKEVTLGPRQKEFMWSYSKHDGLTINRTFKSGDSKTHFSNSDLEKIIGYIKEKERIVLANNVEKLVNGTEKDGLGSFIYQQISKNTTDAQTASHLTAILYSVEVLGYNGASRGMEFWIKDENWRDKLAR